MRNFLYVALTTFLLTACSDTNREFKLKGDVANLNDSIICLYGIFETPDSVITIPVRDGQFEYTLQLDTITPMFLLLDSNRLEVPIFANKGIRMRIKGDTQGQIIAKGGAEQTLYNVFQDSIRNLTSQNEIREVADSFIISNPYSIVSIYLIDKYFIQVKHPNKVLIERTINQLSGIMHDHPYIERILNEISTRTDGQRDRYIPLPVMPDTTGTNVKQTTYKDKFKVISLWASWNENSIALQDSIKELAEEFKKEPVLFVNISLDNNREEWMNIIHKEELFEGIHLCDFKVWDNHFVKQSGASDIPYNVVTDTRNKVLINNINGTQLSIFLKKQIEEYKKKQEEEKRKKKNKKK